MVIGSKHDIGGLALYSDSFIMNRRSILYVERHTLEIQSALFCLSGFLIYLNFWCAK